MRRRMCRDYYERGLTLRQVAAKYGLTYWTTRKIVQSVSPWRWELDA